MGGAYGTYTGICLRGVKQCRILGVTIFAEIIKLQFGKERHTLLCNLKPFLQILLINYL